MGSFSHIKYDGPTLERKRGVTSTPYGSFPTEWHYYLDGVEISGTEYVARYQNYLNERFDRHLAQARELADIMDVVLQPWQLRILAMVLGDPESVSGRTPEPPDNSARH